MNTHFATSQRNDMRPLAFKSILATDCYAQLHEFIVKNAVFLRNRGMPDAASFLAEPMFDEATGLIDWYTVAQDTPLPLASLPPKEQTDLRAKTDRYLAALKALAESAAGKNNKMAAALLALATRHPSDQDIYVLGAAPVLINWGFDASMQVSTESIMRLGDKEPPKPEPPAAQTAPLPSETACSPAVPVSPQVVTAHASIGWTGCLAWFLPFLLLLLLLWLLLASFGLAPSPLPASLFHQDISTEQEAARSRGLRDQAIDLYAKLQARHLQCLPKEPPAEKPVEQPEPPKEEPKPAPDEKETPAAQEPPKEESKPLAQNGLPDFGTPAAAPEESAPKPAFIPPKKGSAMKIPEEAAKNKDLSFLEGCWRSVTNLYNSLTGERIEHEYCFKSTGKGRRRVIEKNGSRCSGSAKAKFSGSALVITAGNATCSSNRYYVPQYIQCKKKGNSSHCYGKETDKQKGRTVHWDAVFIRK